MKKLYSKMIIVIALMMITIISGCNSSEKYASASTNDFEEWAKNITQSISTDERFEVILEHKHSDLNVYDRFGNAVKLYDYNLNDLKSWGKRIEGKNSFCITLTVDTEINIETNKKFGSIFGDFEDKFCDKLVGEFNLSADKEIVDKYYDDINDIVTYGGGFYLLKDGKKCMLSSVLYGTDAIRLDIDIFK